MKTLKRLIVLTISLSLVITSIPVNAFTIKDEYINYRHWEYCYDVSNNAKAVLDSISMTEKEMLDDVIERSFNNDFDKTEYIIKTTGDDTINTEHWNNYCVANGDFHLRVTALEDIFRVKNGNECYHMFTVQSSPMHSPVDWTTRKIERWDQYMDKVKQIENDLGLLSPYSNLCDYEKITLAYMWCVGNIKDENWSSGKIPVSVSRGQEPIEAILDGGAVCAGYTRTMNRFMHDCGINSFYVSDSKANHAYNLINLYGDYYWTDCQAMPYVSLEGYYYNNNNKTLIDCDGVLGALDDVSLSRLSEFDAISAYCSNIVIGKNRKLTPTVPFAEITLPTCTELGYFSHEGKVDEHCDYCGEVHQFKLPPTHRYETTEVVYPTCKQDGYRIKRCSECGNEIRETLPKKRHSYTFSARPSTYTDEGEFIICCKDCNKVLYDEYMPKLVAPETTVQPTTQQTVVETYTEEPPVETDCPEILPYETEFHFVNDEETQEPTQKSTQTPTQKPTQRATEKVTTKEIIAPVEETTHESYYTIIKKPSRLKNVKLKAGKKKVKIAWTKSKNADKYQIKVLKGKKVVYKKTLYKCKFTVKKLKKGKTYKFYVRAYNEAGWSKWSKVKKIKPR